MRPILVSIPAKLLFVVALVLAVAAFARDVMRRRRDRTVPWTPVPIYAYGVMLGTSLVIGWFIAMNLAKQDGIDQQEAGTIYMWTAVWSIVGSRLLYVVTNISEF